MQLLELSLKIMIFSLTGNGIFRPLALQWAGIGPLIMPKYIKPTDTQQLLHKDSFRSKHTFQGIPKSQIPCFFSIVSKITDFDEGWQILNCLIHYAKGTVQKYGGAILKVKLSVNYKYNN